MKKIVALLLAAVLIFALAACSQGEATSFTEQLNKENTLIVATSPDYPPYEYYAEDGSYTGFDIEAVEAIAAIIAEDYDITVEWVAMDFSTIVSAVQLGQVDVGASCFTYDPERDVLFTDYYLKSAQVVVVPEGSDITSVADLAGKTVGAGMGTTGEGAALDAGANVSEMGDYTQMFEILRNNGLDAIVCDEAVGLQYQSQGGFVVLEEKLVDEEVSLIVAKENDLLAQKLNEAIAKFVASDLYGELAAKYGLK